MPSLPSAALTLHQKPRGEPGELDSFSFSLQQTPEVKIWLESRGDKIGLSTCMPDGWYEGSERKQLREELLDALPEGFTRDRWLTW